MASDPGFYSEDSFTAAITEVAPGGRGTMRVRAVAPGGQEVIWQAMPGCHRAGQLVEVTVTPVVD